MLDARAVVTDNRSAVFDAILNRYEAVVTRSLPADASANSASRSSCLETCADGRTF